MAAFEVKKAAMQRVTAPASLSAVSAPVPVPTTTTIPAKKGNKKPSGPLVQEIGSAPSHASEDDDAAPDTTQNDNNSANAMTVPTSAGSGSSGGALAGLMNLNRNGPNAADILDSLRTVAAGGAADDDEMTAADDGKERCVEMNVVLGVLQNGGMDAGFCRPPAAGADAGGGDSAALGDEHTLCTAAAAAASGATPGPSRRPLIAVLNEKGDASSANGTAAAASHMAPAGVDANAGANVVLLPGSAAEDALAEKKRRDAMALLRLTAALLDHGDSDEDSDSDTSSTSGVGNGAVSGQEGTQGHIKPVVQVLRSEDATGAADDAHACG
jgi:hypothetical protein